MKRIIQFGKPILNNEEKESVVKVLSGTQLVHGPKASDFEKKFAKLVGCKYAITVSSCTAGLHLSLLANKIGKGDEVLVPAMSHVATYHVIEYVGAMPIFVDVEKETGNINPKHLESKVTKNTKAIIIVHYLGLPCNMDDIICFIKTKKIILIEDCALALGARYKHKMVGNFGISGCFSFYPVKHITTAEGGMVTTNNKKFALEIRKLKAFGYNRNLNERVIPGIYDVTEMGFNYRMSEIHASIGLVQLKKFDKFLKIRKKNYLFLYNLFKNIEGVHLFSECNKFSSHSFYCLNITIEKKIKIKRNQLILWLKKNGIVVSVHYPKALPEFKFYNKKYSINKNNFRISKWIADNTISLPVAPHLNLKDMEFIYKKVIKGIDICSQKKR